MEIRLANKWDLEELNDFGNDLSYIEFLELFEKFQPNLGGYFLSILNDGNLIGFITIGCSNCELKINIYSEHKILDLLIEWINIEENIRNRADYYYLIADENIEDRFTETPTHYYYNIQETFDDYLNFPEREWIESESKGFHVIISNKVLSKENNISPKKKTSVEGSVLSVHEFNVDIELYIKDSSYYMSLPLGMFPERVYSGMPILFSQERVDGIRKNIITARAPNPLTEKEKEFLDSIDFGKFGE